MISSTKNPS